MCTAASGRSGALRSRLLGASLPVALQPVNGLQELATQSNEQVMLGVTVQKASPLILESQFVSHWYSYFILAWHGSVAMKMQV